LEFELSASHLLARQVSTTWALSPTIFFILVIFQIGSFSLPEADLCYPPTYVSQ
jgi:hypothetical protein